MIVFTETTQHIKRQTKITETYQKKIGKYKNPTKSPNVHTQKIAHTKKKALLEAIKKIQEKTVRTLKDEKNSRNNSFRDLEFKKLNSSSLEFSRTQVTSY